MNRQRWNTYVQFALCLTISIAAFLPQGNTQDNKPAESRSIKALLVAGGCCHDYDRQKLIIPRGVSLRANVEWTIAHQGGTSTSSHIPLYLDPTWADGFDVIVHDECFSDAKEPEWVDRILAPHRAGKPAVLIHCAMHSYRTGTNAWFEFCGIQSPGHGPHYPYKVINLKPEHSIMKAFGTDWSVPKGELYYSQKVLPTAVPLAHAPRQGDNEPQVCIWTNQYHQARVFGTTIGHYNETVAQPEYLDMLTRGILWAVHGDNYPEPRKPNAEQNAEILKLVAVAKPIEQTQPVQCCNQGNLAFEKPSKASSEETDKQNFAKKAFDGNLNTRWCAAGAGRGEWIEVDFGSVQPVRHVRLHWEQPNSAYRYKIEGSNDGETWNMLVDESKNKKKQRVMTHEIDGGSAKLLKVTYINSTSGGWASLFEIEASSEPLPELPKDLAPDQGESASVADVTAPSEFEVRMFAAPPEVNYPVCIAAASTGEVFVGIDEQGSLGKEPNRGRIVRCIDRDGDGRADVFTKFADIDHPRGLIYDAGRLWVLHPPTLSLLIDKDLDGIADEKKTLLTGISTEQVDKRGADHTTNGIRMGIDGWIYIAVGDFGFLNATGTDDRIQSKRGGGIVRIRPDGTDMEVFSWGQRNILDVCIDPYLNMFTRDNTNDGGGWNVRVTHILQGAHYGYPSKYINYPEETMPALADYGGGSGCGGMTVFEPRWPEAFGQAVYTCDWGTSQVYRHRPQANGATYNPDQDVFLKIPRPTDMDIDGSGRMVVASWKNGSFNFSGINVGFVAQIVPKDFLAKPFPQVGELSDVDLLKWLRSGTTAHTIPVQQEMLRRGKGGERQSGLIDLAKDASAPLAGRVAAIFTLKQLLGSAANPLLEELSKNFADIREFALRAMTDRLSEITANDEKVIRLALKDSNPRVQAQSLISLSRLAQASKVSDPDSFARDILPLATLRDADGKERAKPVPHDVADPARVIPHLAIRALRDLRADKVCIESLDSNNRQAALLALREMHTPAAVSGLIAKLDKTQDQELRSEIVGTLARLHYREADYTRGDWWGTRPDTSGPYYDRADWSETSTIAAFLKKILESNDPMLIQRIAADAKRFRLPFGSDKEETMRPVEGEKGVISQKADPNNPNQIGNLDVAVVTERALKVTGNVEKGKQLFTSQSCGSCHTVAAGQQPKGPHLVDIGKRYKPNELVESIVKPNAKIAQGFDTWTILTDEGKVITGFVVLESAETVTLRGADGRATEIAQQSIESRKKQEQSMMPTGLVEALTPEQLSDLLAYLASLH